MMHLNDFKWQLLSLLLIVLLFLPYKINANNIFTNNYATSKEYEEFVNSINKSNVFAHNKYLSLNKRKNLIIGCSPVVFCGFICGENTLDEYSYDVIGFGGTKDGEILEWLQKLDPFYSYENIVIWGSVNDIMSGAIGQCTDLSDEYKTVIKTMFTEAKKHLYFSNNLYYVNPVFMVEGLDTYIPNDNQEKSNHSGFSYYFNELAQKVIDFIKTTNVKTIDVDFDTTSVNSDWYVHYTNPDVFISIFEKVKNHF